ncbi:hypothetical protein [cf. Phormidesmis sp. LEGE 11477]|uniref:hypothetical protein n=1 Tax=cf. Phormidesmis sp. LEGE 11477 TaxID=1828680 RepID=UPI001882A4B0|nr:hypothetical protein [cf. Phormidesmis sp. LEGE 11477]MBE9061850.1 hypothetical protein [cf. Phormidesmis sp. LEGE 11477]
MPEFVSAADREKVDRLMQPALIRVIDNIRKQLDSTAWEGRYEEKLVWPEGTTPSQQEEYARLQKGLHGVPTEEHDRVAALIAVLPQPSPLYTLRLTHDGQVDQTVDIWSLCYRVCASAPSADAKIAAQDNLGSAIATDNSLFDEFGEVDWRALDDKTLGLVKDIFAALPA